MALVSVSSKCFSTLETAIEALTSGSACSSEVMLKSLKQDGLRLQQQASALCCQLNKAEEEHQLKEEDLTRQVNGLHEEEVQLTNRKQALETKKSALTDEKERCSRNKQDALRRSQKAEEEKREAEKKCEELQDWWWVPIYGQLLAVREIVENNMKKARDAYRDMQRYDRDMERAESEIVKANSAILQVLLSHFFALFSLMCSPTDIDRYLSCFSQNEV